MNGQEFNRAPARRERTVRPHYLRDLGDDLAAAIALAAHDLVVTGVMTAGEAESALQYRADLRLRHRGDGERNESAALTIFYAFEDLQQDLLEGVGQRPALVVWPRCPLHHNHPLWLSFPAETDPAWTCPETNAPVSELGDL